MCEPAISDPMSFLYLDLWANILLNEMVEMERDFNAKMEFLREQELNTLENVKNLLNIDDFLDLLRKCIIKIEIEINVNEGELITAETAVERLERSLSSPGIEQSRMEPLQRYTYHNLLKLLLSADRSAAQCASLKDEIEEFNHEMIDKIAPTQMITNIIHYHNKTLELLEKQITQLESQAKELKVNFDDIAKGLDISSLTAKLHCQMGAEVMDDNNDFQILK